MPNYPLVFMEFMVGSILIVRGIPMVQEGLGSSGNSDASGSSPVDTLPQPLNTGGFPNAHGQAGFTPGPGTDYTSGIEAEIARRLDRLGRALGIRLTGISGFRTPQHSIAVGGSGNDPHTRGQASDTIGIENVPESILWKFGLTRPFSGSREANHIQLAGSVPWGSGQVAP